MGETGLAENSGFMEQVRAIRRNDTRALQEVYTSNYPVVEKFVLNNNGTSDEAKDVFQEAFTAMWRNIQLDKFIPHSSSALGGYLFQIARNKWMDHLRSAHRTKVIHMDDGQLPSFQVEEIPVDDQKYIDAVKKYFPKLGDNCRKILQLYYYSNESMRAIAGQMGWTEATAKNNKYRCLQKLKELINQSS